jgi:hypothetical protein
VPKIERRSKVEVKNIWKKGWAKFFLERAVMITCKGKCIRLKSVLPISLDIDAGRIEFGLDTNNE